MVTHAVLIIDTETGDIYPCHQRGYNTQDVECRVTEALAQGSGNTFEGMVAVIDPLPSDIH